MQLPSVVEAGVNYFLFYASILMVEASSSLGDVGSHGTNLKRDVMASLAEQCGPDIYCLPKFNTTWTMGSVGLLRWNSNYPTFKVQGHVDIRLYEMTNPRKPVKEWLDITNDEGLWSVKLDRTSGIFPEDFNRPKNVTVVRNYRFLVTVRDDLIEGRQKGPIFNIEDPPPPEEANPTPTDSLYFAIPIANHSLLVNPSKINHGSTASASALATTPSSHFTNDPQKTSNNELINTNAIISAQQDQNTPFDLSLNTIVGITASVLAGLILIGLTYCFVRRNNRSKFSDKTRALHCKNGKYTMAMSSQQRNTCDFSRYSLSGCASTDAFLPAKEMDTRDTMLDTISHRSPCILAALPSSLVSDNQLSPTDERAKPMSLCLTVKDAQLIADTYRRLLRKPSWNEDDVKELEKRNTYTDELLRRELEAEGKGVKQVNVAPTIIIVNEEQKVHRKSMMSIERLEELSSLP